MEKRRRQTSVKKEETANNNFSPKQDSLHEWKASNLLTHDTQWWLVTLRGLQGELQQWRGAAEMKDCTGWWRVLRTQYLHRTESLAKRHLGAGLADLRTHSCCWLHLVSPKWAWISRRCADSCKSSESALNQKVQAHWDYPYSTQKLLPSCWDWMAWIWTLPPHSVYMEADFFPSLFVVVVVVMVLLSIFAFFFVLLCLILVLYECKYDFSHLASFFCTRNQTQGLTLARQVLMLLNYNPGFYHLYGCGYVLFFLCLPPLFPKVFWVSQI